jgi:hypothetical protein
MTRVLLDQTTLAKLKDIRGYAELCDSAGNVLGYFTPSVVDYERVEPEIKPDELARIRQEPTYSTEEVLAHLRNL